jgi:hypothetical protein
VWETTIDGKTLHFHLAGINNQNFIMRDEETGSWWQQVSGEAILGPLKGRRLTRVPQDEISFALWKREQPQGRVLRPDPRVEAAGRYAPADWEARITKLPVATLIRDPRLGLRELVIGMTVNGHAKAYRMTDVQQQNPIIDTIGGVPIVIVAAADGRSLRAFSRMVDGKPVDLFAIPDASRFVDSATGSEWDFAGRAVRGPLTGRQLERIEVLCDYWFDWRAYHPDTAIYSAGVGRRISVSRQLGNGL